MKINIAIFIVLLILLNSCKENLAPPPVIEVYSPTHASTWIVGDSIEVKANIQSSIPLEFVEVSLLEPGLVVANPVFSTHLNSNSFSLDIEYPLSNLSLESGQYYLLIEAGNGDGVEKEFVSITLSSIPKQSKTLLVYTYESGGNTSITKVDSLLQAQSFKTLSGDFSGGAVNSADQYLYSLGKYDGSFFTLDAGSGSIIDEIPAVVNPPFPYYTCISYENNRLLIGLYEEYIKGYYGNGNPKFTYHTELFRPTKLKYDGTYILGSFDYFTGSGKAFGVIYEISGLIRDIVFTSFETVNFFRESGDEVLIFGQNSGTSEVYTLNTQTMVITQIKSLPAGEMYAVTSCGDNHYLISHDNGILQYNYASNTYSDFYAGAKTGLLCFDEVDERLYLSSGKEIYSYSYPGAIESGPLVLTDSIKDMHILYNR